MTDPAAFWSAVWDYFDVLGDRGDGPVLAGEVMPDVRWFAGATLNYARNALRTAWTDPDRTAIIFDSERGRAGSLSYGQLAQQVARVARGLRAARRRPRRPGCGPAAERPGGGRRPAGHREPGRDLVVLLAGLRRAQRDRQVRADRAEGADRLRRLRLQRQGVLPGRDGRGGHRGPARPVRRGPGEPARRRRAASRGDPLGATWARKAITTSTSPSSRRCRSRTRSGWSTHPAPPACRSRSCTATAASSWSTSRRSRSTRICAPATSSPGTPRPAG